MANEKRFVSIEDLSTWLAAYATPPLYAMAEIMEHEDMNEEMTSALQANRRAKAWQYHIEQLIGCGLLQGVTVVVNNAKDYYRGEETCVELSGGNS